MTLLLFAGTAYVCIGVLVMFAVRCWGIWEPLHMHGNSYSYENCAPGPPERCPAHYVGRKPLPLAGWVFGAAIWPLVLVLWFFIVVVGALVRVGSVRV